MPEYDSIVPHATISRNSGSQPRHTAAGAGENEMQENSESQVGDRDLEKFSSALYQQSSRLQSKAGESETRFVNEQLVESISVKYDTVQTGKVSIDPASGYSVLNRASGGNTRDRRHSLPDEALGYDKLGGVRDLYLQENSIDTMTLQFNTSYGEIISCTSQDEISDHESLSESKQEESAQTSLDPTNQRQQIHCRSSKEDGSSPHVIPTDPETGYSKMLRDGVKNRPSGNTPAYDIVDLKVKRINLPLRSESELPGEEGGYSVAYRAEAMAPPLYQNTSTHGQNCSQYATLTSHDHLGVASTALTSPSQYSNTVAVPTNPETGYSSMIRQEKAGQSRPGSLQGYDTIERKDSSMESSQSMLMERQPCRR